jgi:hypothetical protein
MTARAEDAERAAYDETCSETLSRRDAEFTHQHVVDAFAAQHANAQSTAIGVTFALVGLYLFVEKGWTGRQVQRVHMLMARRKRSWPSMVLPSRRGSMTAREVATAPARPDRDAAIRAWCESVWSALAENRQTVAQLLAEHGIDTAATTGENSRRHQQGNDRASAGAR